MSWRRPEAMLGRVGESDETVRLELEVERGEGPIRGCLWNGSKQPHPFTGWLQLTTMLERARSLSSDDPVRQEERA